jgi:hypothetical protein
MLPPLLEHKYLECVKGNSRPINHAWTLFHEDDPKHGDALTMGDANVTDLSSNGLADGRISRHCLETRVYLLGKSYASRTSSPLAAFVMV